MPVSKTQVKKLAPKSNNNWDNDQDESPKQIIQTKDYKEVKKEQDQKEFSQMITEKKVDAWANEEVQVKNNNNHFEPIQEEDSVKELKDWTQHALEKARNEKVTTIVNEQTFFPDILENQEQIKLQQELIEEKQRELNIDFTKPEAKDNQSKLPPMFINKNKAETPSHIQTVGSSQPTIVKPVAQPQMQVSGGPLKFTNTQSNNDISKPLEIQDESVKRQMELEARALEKQRQIREQMLTEKPAEQSSTGGGFRRKEPVEAIKQTPVEEKKEEAGNGFRRKEPVNDMPKPTAGPFTFVNKNLSGNTGAVVNKQSVMAKNSQPIQKPLQETTSQNDGFITVTGAKKSKFDQW